MTPETEQQYKNQIAALQAEIEKLKNQQTKAIQREKYGLNWIDVPEEFDEKSKNSIPVLKEIKNKTIKNNDGKPTHILIEGDNYHALTCLNYTHAGKIDVIYIDPPYNTGNKDFVYNDKFVDAEDEYRHSKWLSFMSKRLRIAKRLLSDKGVIFISIDDNEQAQLKLLCDEVLVVIIKLVSYVGVEEKLKPILQKTSH
jgi:adenine-specific DNA-methyltransferase